MDIYRRLIKLTKPHLGRFVIALFCMLVAGGLTSVLAFLVKPALDDIFIKKDMAMLTWVPVAIVAIYLLKGVCSYTQTIIMNFIGQRIVADVRSALYRHIQMQSMSFFMKNPTGVLMSRVMNDVRVIQGAVSEALTSLLKDTFTLICLIFVIFYRDWQLAIIAMFVFPLAVLPIIRFGKRMRKVARRTQISIGTLTAQLQETISGVTIVKAFGREDYESERFSRHNERYLRLTMKALAITAISHPVMDLLGGIGVAAIIAYGGYQVIQGNSTPGTFFSFLTALIMLYEPVKKLSGVNNTIQQGIVGAQRVFSIMDMPPEILDKPEAVPLPRITTGITLEHVSFSYGEAPVLKDITLRIAAGECIAFVGTSGGGKTTLVNLIPRFYDVTAGRILIDGLDIRDVTMASLRGQIGIVTQQTILFNDTVRNNILYGDLGKTEEDIVQAAKAANAHDFITNLPQGYDTVIGDQGARLSGGERQRISVARALLKDAPILILDEATSSLDTESEAEVQGALENLMKGRTTLVIAHRLSTIRNADRIVVIVGGEIAEEGSHESLMAREGEYYRLYQMQFKDENNHRDA